MYRLSPLSWDLVFLEKSPCVYYTIDIVFYILIVSVKSEILTCLIMHYL